MKEFLMDWGKKIENEIAKPIKGKYGSMSEGIVIKFPNGKTIKITTDTFATMKKELI